MSNETKTSKRFADVPRDKPQVDRVEHANLDRPGAQAHPRAARSGSGDWSRHMTAASWTLR
jgi:hypothetical protein